MSEVKQRYSKQRETILNVLRNDCTHPNVDSIFMKVREIIPDISLGTVYRNLNQLSDNKDILKLDFGDGVVHFDGTTAPHFHMVCDECRQVEDVFVDESLVAAFQKNVRKKSNAHITQTDVLFHGICQHCLKQKS